MKKLILIFASLVFMVSCGQNKPIDEAPIDLQNVDFNRDFSSFFPEKLRSKDYPNMSVYDVSQKDEGMSTSFQKDSLFINPYSDEKEFKGFQTSQINWDSRNHYATFGALKFQKIGLVSSANGKTEAVSAMADDLTKGDTANYFAVVKNKLGTPKKLKNSWNEQGTAYEWVKDGKIYRMASQYNDESNTMKIVIDKDAKTITNGEIEPHYQVYLFIARQDLKKELLKKMRKGDFVYFRVDEDQE